MSKKSSYTSKVYSGKPLPYAQYVLRHDNVILMPENADGVREKKEFPSINQAKKRSRELMNQKFQITTK